jgi:L-amino acid N-acyltransferase YncA
LIEFREEHWEEVRDEFFARLPEHYAEAFQDDAYDPIIEEYDFMGKHGLICFVAARREGELVGYMLWCIRYHLLQRTVLWAVLDNYWLQKDARGPRVAQRMIKAAETILQARGVRKAYAMEKAGGRLFDSCGWRAKELGFLRELRP